MGVLFTLDTGLKAVIQQGLTDLITELGKDVRLYYPPIAVPCSCTLDGIGNKSTDIWRSGAPLPISNQLCPNCGGKGKIMSEKTDTLHLLCATSQKDFFYPITGVDLQVPFSFIQLKGFLTDVPKIMRADYFVVETGIEGLIRQKYRRWDEPMDRSNIIQGVYFNVTLKRI